MTPALARLYRRFQWLTIAAFALALAAPGLRALTTDESASVKMEMRLPAPAPQPTWQIDAMRTLPREVELFFKDRLGFRRMLIRWNNLVTVVAFGRSPTDTILVGQDGWLFYTGEQSLEAGRGLLPLTEEELERWRCLLQARRDWLAARGVPYVVVVAPDKHTVYPDRMPDGTAGVGPTRYDQLADYLAARSDVTFVDLRPALAEARRDQLLYYPLGTHWNAIGAHVAYGALRAVVARWFPALAARPLPTARFDLVDDPGDTWATGLHLDGLLRQPVYAPRDPAPPRWIEEPSPFKRFRTTTIPGSSLPKAVVFHDSFAKPWMTALSDDFSRVRFAWQTAFDFAVVAQEKPDVVIHEIVERFLVLRPDSNAVPPATAAVRWVGSAVDPPRPATEGGEDRVPRCGELDAAQGTTGEP